MKYLKLSPEYECSPLWISFDGSIYENLDIDDSPFDEVLKKQISDWAKSFDITLNQDYPPDSGFSTRQQEEQFEYSGLDIWKNITQHYSDKYDKIILNSHCLAKLYEDVLEYENDLEKEYK